MQIGPPRSLPPAGKARDFGAAFPPVLGQPLCPASMRYYGTHRAPGKADVMGKLKSDGGGPQWLLRWATARCRRARAFHDDFAGGSEWREQDRQVGLLATVRRIDRESFPKLTCHGRATCPEHRESREHDVPTDFPIERYARRRRPARIIPASPSIAKDAGSGTSSVFCKYSSAPSPRTSAWYAPSVGSVVAVSKCSKI